MGQQKKGHQKKVIEELFLSPAGFGLCLYRHNLISVDSHLSRSLST